MTKTKIIVAILFLVAVLSISFFVLSKFLKPPPGGLIVKTVPVSSVYINGIFVGKTPYGGTSDSSQINLKLIPDGGHELLSYETKINLISGVKTVVDREFGETEEYSSGDVISFDKNNGPTSGLVLITNPDGATVTIDGLENGKTPLNLDSLLVGNHKINIKSDGYVERNLNLKSMQGLRLSVYVKLAKSTNQTTKETSSPIPKSDKKVFVTIQDTPTGFLRMRTEPGTKGEEIAELKTGEKYLYLETDKNSGWYKIQYKDAVPGLPNGIVGWVSNQYSVISQ